MKNKKNILVRIWRAIWCLDYIEEQVIAAQLHQQLQQEKEAEKAEIEEEDNTFSRSTEQDGDTLRKILGDNYTFWRLEDSWPSELIKNEIAPKIVLSMNARTFMFHVSTWAAVNGKNARDLCITIRENMDLNTFDRWYLGILLLPEGPDAQEFKTWWDAYLERFGISKETLDAKNTDIFPELNTGDMLEGIICKHSGMKYVERLDFWNPGKAMFEEWCWIVKHCIGKVWVTPTHFIFEDQADAVLYKLSNSDK
jgi:hypothetical protein